MEREKYQYDYGTTDFTQHCPFPKNHAHQQLASSVSETMQTHA